MAKLVINYFKYYHTLCVDLSRCHFCIAVIDNTVC